MGLWCLWFYVQEHPKAQPDQNQQPKGLIRIYFYSENKHYFTEVVRQINFGVQMATAQIIMYQTYILRRFFLPDTSRLTTFSSNSKFRSEIVISMIVLTFDLFISIDLQLKAIIKHITSLRLSKNYGKV